MIAFSGFFLAIVSCIVAIIFDHKDLDPIIPCIGLIIGVLATILGSGFHI